MLKLFDYEYKLASVVWEFEPVRTSVLINVCSERLGWSRHITYRVLRKLCERGILQNKSSVVTALIRSELIQKDENEVLLTQSPRSRRRQDG